MELVEAKVTVSKEAYELGIALGKIAVAAKKALADGVQVSDATSMLAVMMSPEVVAGIAGIDGLSAELKENKAAFVAAFAVAGVKLAEEL